MSKPTTLYRIYDSDDKLLYVGITCRPIERLKEHRREKEGWPDYVRVDLEIFPDREAALAAEEAAIAAENPEWNLVVGPGRPTRRHPTRRPTAYPAPAPTQPRDVEHDEDIDVDDDIPRVRALAAYDEGGNVWINSGGGLACIAPGVVKSVHEDGEGRMVIEWEMIGPAEIAKRLADSPRKGSIVM